MKTSHTLYISLGSNINNKLGYLQNAVHKIYNEIGDIEAISSVYQTPAWGFSSEDFYNACVVVRTFLSTEQALQQLLDIENRLGRERTGASGYEARTIDLDIILSSEGIFNTETLTVPHPRMEDRKFVLAPLVDIAANVVHPIRKQTIDELLRVTSDTATVIRLAEQLHNPKSEYSFSAYRYLSVEGNIGAGKTSLSHIIAREFNAKLILERFADNPFLPKFYEDMERYAFPLEMSFLADRYQHIQEDIAQFDLFKDFVISDYNVFKSLIFAKVTLQKDEFAIYKRVFDMMYRNLTQPDLYIYLYQNTDRLLAQIKKRGREYEQNIPATYLDKINKGYLQFIKSQSGLNIRIIDVSEKDFIANRQDYIWVLDQITQS